MNPFETTMKRAGKEDASFTAASVGMNQHPAASIIIRTKNEQALLAEVLAAVYNQTFRNFEVIVVDSGSTDRTLEIARAFPIKLIEIRPEEFTYGRALNIGCAAAQGKFLVLISAHAVPLTAHWLASLVKHFDDPNVAAVWGACTERRRDLPPPRIVRQDMQMFLSKPSFGLSNTNAAIRGDLWHLHPFDELLPGTEDKEWAYRVLRCGYSMVYDASAVVWHYHAETLRKIWHRSHVEHVGYASFLEFPVPSCGELFRRVCSQTLHQSWHGENWKQRIAPVTIGLPRLVAREIGRYTALRKATPVIAHAERTSQSVR